MYDIYYIILYHHIVSYHIIYHTISYIISYHIIPYHISYHIYHTISHYITLNVTSSTSLLTLDKNLSHLHKIYDACRSGILTDV